MIHNDLMTNYHLFYSKSKKKTQTIFVTLRLQQRQYLKKMTINKKID